MKPTTKLAIVVAISITFFMTEIAIGFRTKSLALIADAFHYLNDIIAYMLAFVAAYYQEKGKKSPGFTFAFHRGELVGAFFNGVFLLALALSIFLQAIERFINVQPVDKPVLILIVGCVGLTLNILSVLIVHEHHGHSHGDSPIPDGSDSQDIELSDVHPSDSDVPVSFSLHTHHNHVSLPPIPPRTNLGLLGVLTHLFGDAVNNICVIIAAIIIWRAQSPHRVYADPAVSLFISLFIFMSAIPLSAYLSLHRSGRVLLEACPAEVDLKLITEDLLAVPGVLSIHDVHVWQLSQTLILASFHVRLPATTDFATWAHTEETLQQCCAAYGISHVTIAPEVGHDDNSGGGDVARHKAAQAACDNGSGCAVDDSSLFQIRKRIGRSV